MRDRTGSDQAALFVLGGALAAMGIAALFVRNVESSS
jgi:LPXTG-motif cell wall-anchored protein